MEVSSRTPEGFPNSCPVCKKSIQIDPSIPFGDAPCPNCGCLLWFVAIGGSQQFFEFKNARLLRERAIQFLAVRFGTNADDLKRSSNIWGDTGADSLDMIELVMELESELE